MSGRLTVLLGMRDPRSTHSQGLLLGDSLFMRHVVEFSANRRDRCSFVCSYPSVSYLAGGKRRPWSKQTWTKNQTTPDSVFTRERRNSDHGLSFRGGETQTMV